VKCRLASRGRRINRLHHFPESLEKKRRPEHRKKVDPRHGRPRHSNGHALLDVGIHEGARRPEEAEAEEKHREQGNPRVRPDPDHHQGEQEDHSLASGNDPFPGSQPIREISPCRASRDCAQIHQEDQMSCAQRRQAHGFNEKGARPERLEGGKTP
jgi:hypothetical protein